MMGPGKFVAVAAAAAKKFDRRNFFLLVYIITIMINSTNMNKTQQILEAR